MTTEETEAVTDIDAGRGDRDEAFTVDERCCEHGCNGGACETCACCCAGWCVSGVDGEPAGSGADFHQQAYWEEIRDAVAAGEWP